MASSLWQASASSRGQPRGERRQPSDDKRARASRRTCCRLLLSLTFVVLSNRTACFAYRGCDQRKRARVSRLQLRLQLRFLSGPSEHVTIESPNTRSLRVGRIGQLELEFRLLRSLELPRRAGEQCEGVSASTRAGCSLRHSIIATLRLVDVAHFDD